MDEAAAVMEEDQAEKNPQRGDGASEDFAPSAEDPAESKYLPSVM